jgi:hypothetical protein
MRPETALRVEAIDLLIKGLGVLDTERFITSIKSDKFDYTEWHKNLWNDMTIDEIHTLATDFEYKKHKNG